MQADKVISFVNELRAHKTGVEARSAVLEGNRFDIFRGKDFVRWVRANIDTIDLQVIKGTPATKDTKSSVYLLALHVSLVSPAPSSHCD